MESLARDLKLKNKEYFMLIKIPYEDYFPTDRNELHFQRYKKFILRCINRGHLKKDLERIGEIEYHHILPSSLWDYSLGGDKVKNQIYLSKDVSFNVIGITLREHFIAHLILWKAFPNSYMSLSFLRMASSNQNGKRKWVTNKQYEKVKKEVNELRSKQNKNRKWIFNEELEQFKFVKKDEVSFFIEQGWIFKTPRTNFFHTEETKEKISASHQNKSLSEEHKYNLSISHLGQEAWNKGIPCKEETKQLLSKINKGKKLSKETGEKMGKSRTGEKHFRASVYLCVETQEIFYTYNQIKTITGIDPRGIIECVKGDKLFQGGYRWIKLESDEPAYVKSKIKELPSFAIKCEETKEIFYSAREILDKYNILNRVLLSCLKGNKKTAGGYHWKILE